MLPDFRPVVRHLFAYSGFVRPEVSIPRLKFGGIPVTNVFAPLWFKGEAPPNEIRGHL